MLRESLVSVILPTYNREDFLPDAVRSVLFQTYEHWELIVVDDGSTDGTRQYLSRLDDPRLHVIEQVHSGNPAAVRNVGLAQAAGAYVAFLDSDDVWLPEKLRVQIGAMERDPEIGWSYTFFRRMDEQGHDIHDPWPPSWKAHSGWILRHLIPIETVIGTSSGVVAQRGLLQDVGGFDEAQVFCQDYELWFRLAAASKVIAIADPLYRIRVHPRSHQSDREAVHRAWLRAYEKLAATTQGELAQLCHREIARHMAWLVNHERRHGSLSSALRQALRTVRYDPTIQDSWVALIRVLLTPFVPRRARQALRAVVRR